MRKIPTTGRLSIQKILPAVVTIAAFIIAGLNIGKAIDVPTGTTQTWEWPTAYSDSESGADVVIDQANTRITITNTEGEVTGHIEGEAAGSRLKPGMAIHTNGENVYIANAVSDSSTSVITREEILKFDMQGNYLETIGVKEWNDGKIHSAYSVADFYYTGDSFADDNLRVLIVEGDHVDLCQPDENKDLVTIGTVVLPDKEIYRCNFNVFTGMMAIVTMSGDIYTYDGNTLETVYTYDGRHLFNYAIAENDGVVYASDFNDRSIYVIRGKEAPQQWLTNVEARFLTPSDDKIIFCDEFSNTLRQVSTTDKTSEHWKTVSYSPMYILRVMIICLSYLWLIGFIIYGLIRWGVRRRRKARESAKDKDSGQNPLTRGGAIAFMFISAIIVTTSFITYYTAENHNTTIEELSRAATLFTNNSADSFGNALSRINAPKDLYGDSYAEISEYLNDFWNANVQNNFNCYYFMMRLKDDKVMVVADSDNQYQPGTVLSEHLSDTEVGRTVAAGNNYKGTNDDGWGRYDYVTAPLYDKTNTLVGGVEIGVYQQNFNQTQFTKVVNIIIMVLTMLMGSIIFISEFGAIRRIFRNMNQVEGVERTLSLIRPIAFFCYLFASMDTVYTTIIVKNLLTSNDVPNAGVLHPLVLSAIAAGFLIGSLNGPLLTGRIPIKRLLCVVLGMLAALGLAMGTALYLNNAVFYIISVCMASLLQGLLFTLITTLPALSQDESMRFKHHRSIEVASASSTVLATAIGGYAAQYLGYAGMYAVVAVITLVPLFICIFGLTDTGILQEPEKAGKAEKTPLRDFARFLFSPRGALPMVGSLAAILIASGYKTYLFPLYSQSLGYNLVEIANVIVIVGSVSVIFETRINEAMARVDIQKVYALVLFIMAVIMVFSVLNPGYGWSMLFIMVSQLSLSVCTPYEYVFFAERGKNFGISDSTAIGADVAWGNVVRIARPLVFGWIMWGGYTSAGMILAAILAVTASLFLLLTRKTKGARPQAGDAGR